jgi:DNA-binding response OmpR family regulator
MIRVLLVEDEPVLGDAIRLSLSKMGLECEWVTTLQEARSALSRERFDLWVLDRNLPDGEGTALLSTSGRSHALVLILSSKSGVEERVQGLKMGADDYLPKPFSYRELEARLEALSRRLPPASSSATGTHWVLDRDSLKLRTERVEVVLTPLEFKFMEYLLAREGSIVSKDRLLKDVWGFAFLPKTRTVDYLINQLRKRIEPDPEHPRHLLTIRGAGVKLLTLGGLYKEPGTE